MIRTIRTPRSKTYTRALVSLIFVGLLACGKEDLPESPQLLVDREAITFGGEFGNATYLGQRPQESIVLENGGLEPLELSAQFQGDPAFTMEGPLEARIEGKQRTFIRVIFAPVEERDYSGTIVVTSNAENAAVKNIVVSGRGVAPPGDAGP